MRFLKNKNKGITLVSLVITIIVMLILTGVTINIVIKDGLISKVINAKEETKKAMEKEQVSLAISSALSKGLGKISNIRNTGEKDGDLDKSLDETFGIDGWNISDNLIDGPWTLTINETGRIYIINNTGEIEEVLEGNIFVNNVIENNILVNNIVENNTSENNIIEENTITDEYTALLLHGENLTDSSYNIKTIINNNSVVSNERYKFGESSLYFNGSSSVYMEYGSTGFNDCNFGSNDFTIDFWMNATSFNSGTTIASKWGQKYYYSWIIGCSSGKIDLHYSTDTGNIIKAFSSPTILSTNTWYHIAIVRSNTTIKLYINGQLDTTGTMSGSLANPVKDIRIGRNGDLYNYPGNTFSGYIDEFRISNIARWSNDFTLMNQEY